jgi:hypothetical protein
MNRPPAAVPYRGLMPKYLRWSIAVVLTVAASPLAVGTAYGVTHHHHHHHHPDFSCTAGAGGKGGAGSGPTGQPGPDGADGTACTGVVPPGFSAPPR